jgi:hypothetical protein
MGRAMAQAVTRRLSLRKPGLDPGSVHVELMVDKVAWKSEKKTNHRLHLHHRVAQ